MTVERGNLPSSERCGGSRLMVGDNTYTIAPPLRREWPLTCQGLPAPQHNRPPYRSVMRVNADGAGHMRGNRDICYRYYTRFSHRAPQAAPEDDGCSAVNWTYSGRHTNKCDEPSRNAPMLRLRWPFLGESYLLI